MTSHYGIILVMVFQVRGQRVPALRAFLDLEKTVLHEIHVSGTVVNPLLMRKSPILHVHKQKTVIVETVLVIFV